jgi:hypothetical protein
MLHTHYFSHQNAVYFIMLPFLVTVLFKFYIQDVVNLNLKLRCQKVKRDMEKYCRAGQATDDIMAHAENLRLKIHT